MHLIQIFHINNKIYPYIGNTQCIKSLYQNKSKLKWQAIYEHTFHFSFYLNVINANNN